jgi:hypothetical protein
VGAHANPGGGGGLDDSNVDVERRGNVPRTDTWRLDEDVMEGNVCTVPTAIWVDVRFGVGADAVLLGYG